jgi:hypothetical protein
MSDWLRVAWAINGYAHPLTAFGVAQPAGGRLA